MTKDFEAMKEAWSYHPASFSYQHKLPPALFRDGFMAALDYLRIKSAMDTNWPDAIERS